MQKTKILAFIIALSGINAHAQNAVYNVTPPVLLDTYTTQLQSDVNGNLKVNVAAGGSGSGSSDPAASVTGVSVPASAIYNGFNLSGNLVGVSASHPMPVDGSSVTQPVSLSSLPSLSAGAAAIGLVGVTSLPSLSAGTASIGSVTLGAGSSAIGSVSISSGNIAVSSLPAIPSGANTIGAVNVNGTVPVSIGSLPALSAGSAAIGSVSVSSIPALPAGSATIGNVNVVGTVPVSGFPATQAVSGTVSIGSLPAGSNTIGSVNINGTVPISGSITAAQAPYPSGAAPLSASSGNVSNAAAAATLAAASGKSTYVTGFEMSGSGATLGSVVICTLSGTVGGTMSYIFAAPTGLLAAGNMLNMHFEPPLISSATNTAITASCPALGLGNTNAAMSIHGYQL